MTADTGQQIWGILGKVITAGGGGAVVAFALFRYLGKGWIEHQFARELESAKSEISILSARRLKLHDREYIVFPELWTRLNQTVSSLERAVISFRTVPNFLSMQKSEVDEWISKSDLSEDEKIHIYKESDKVKALTWILDFRDIRKAREDFIDFHTYLRSNRIFLSPEIKTKLDSIDNAINGSWVARKMDWDGHVNSDKSFLLEAVNKLEEEVKPLMVDIEKLVQARLFPSGITK